jgi:hypothetical protein
MTTHSMAHLKDSLTTSMLLSVESTEQEATRRCLAILSFIQPQSAEQ